jgi:23S rRNA (uridine2552-2'-O)-methyltransferase
MSKRWVIEHKRDPYTRRAKREDYRSRASYKLLQLNRRFRLVRPGSVVLDLGCAPGGWSQVAVQAAGAKGLVVGVDLDPVEPVEGAVFVRGDLREPRTQDAVRAALGGRGVDTVLSDMAPNISGAYDVDHARSMELARLAAEFGMPLLRPGGGLLVKLFAGPELGPFVAALRTRFERVKRTKPDASRKASSEVYVCALGHTGAGAPDWAAFAPRGGAEDEDDDDVYWPDDDEACGTRP